MATPRIADQIGRVLGGRYRLVAPIGTGASAHVYLADDVSLRRRVAVKVLHPALAGDESFLRRFRAEAQAVAGLRHPHIMNVYDWGQDDDGPYLVLEHLGGGSLRDLLHRGPLTPAQALRVGLEAARGLDYAHRRGLVHRDIKPANLLFDDEARLSIADFGLARALAEAAWTEPAGAVLGTARYASPEQAKGASVDGKSDVYALALTLVEAVTGRVPFAADTTIATLMGRIDRHLEVPPEMGPLGPVLAAAAHPELDGRIGAGELVQRLEAAAPDLPRPEPLALLRDPEHDIDLTQAADLTAIGRDGPANHGRAGPGRGGAGRLFDGEAEAARAAWREAEAEPARGGRARRRLGRVLLALIALAALAGGAFAAVTAGRPTYPVPDFRGDTLADAQRLVVGRQEFRVREARGDFFHEEVPAGRILGQDPAAGRRLRRGSAIQVRLSDGPAPRAVPSLASKTRAEAEQSVREAGFTLAAQDAFSETVPRDTVIDWLPKEGTHPKGSVVNVTISKGKEPKPVPGFLDKLYDDYQKVLEALGFKVKREEAFSDKVDAGQIVTTRPAPGDPADAGAEVTVVVSKGPDEVTVPEVAGRSVDQAIELLRQAGLRVGGPYGPPNARRAYSTSPDAGSKVKRGSTVDLYSGR